MSNTNRKANVLVDGALAGLLEESDAGYVFTYDGEYLKGSCPKAVSLTLPLRQESYISKTLFPFFDGLIPEGWLLEVAVRNWKLDSNDRFSILMVACNDCIGNVSIVGVNE